MGTDSLLVDPLYRNVELVVVDNMRLGTPPEVDNISGAEVAVGFPRSHRPENTGISSPKQAPVETW